MKSPQKFLLETRNELKKVSWPSKENVYQLTALVIVVSLIVGLFLTGMDFIFSRLIELVLKFNI